MVALAAPVTITKTFSFLADVESLAARCNGHRTERRKETHKTLPNVVKTVEESANVETPKTG